MVCQVSPILVAVLSCHSFGITWEHHSDLIKRKKERENQKKNKRKRISLKKNLKKRTEADPEIGEQGMVGRI